MTHLLRNPTLASLFDFNVQPHMIAIIIPVVVLIIGGTIAIVALYFEHQRRRLWHETARIALEKGQPVPEPSPDLANGKQPTAAIGSVESARMQRCRGLIIGGLVNLAVGSGLFLALSKVAGDASYFAAIPAFVGVALLLGAGIDLMLSRNMEK